MGRLVSFDISSDFGFFKKPDINKYGLTYNVPPKPAILGFLGAILGISGLKKQYEANELLTELINIKKSLGSEYNKARRISKQINLDDLQKQLTKLDFKQSSELIKQINKIVTNTKSSYTGNKQIVIDLIYSVEQLLLYPEYYRLLKDIFIGVMPSPISTETKFPFNKIMNVYNSKNSYFYTKRNTNKSKKADNVLIKEQILIRPKYRIYVYDESNSKLIDELISRLQNNSPTFMPYLGKNEFIATIHNVQVILSTTLFEDSRAAISSVFIPLEDKISEQLASSSLDMSSNSLSVKGLPLGYVFYEQHPV
jgi:CRISPR-associated protein Cas5 subtype I-B